MRINKLNELKVKSDYVTDNELFFLFIILRIWLYNQSFKNILYI